MQTATFKEWTLTKLDNAFGIKQVLDTDCLFMQKWQALSQNLDLPFLTSTTDKIFTEKNNTGLFEATW